MLRREQLKREGKLLTGKAKAEAERLAAVREQLLKQAAEKGIELPAEGEAAEAAKPKKVSSCLLPDVCCQMPLSIWNPDLLASSPCKPRPL